MSSVNHPVHYNQGQIEIIDAIEDWKLGFNDGNAVKYIARHRYKNEPVKDVEKAVWYLNRLLGEMVIPTERDRILAVLRDFIGRKQGLIEIKVQLELEALLEEIGKGTYSASH